MVRKWLECFCQRFKWWCVVTTFHDAYLYMPATQRDFAEGNRASFCRVSLHHGKLRHVSALHIAHALREHTKLRFTQHPFSSKYLLWHLRLHCLCLCVCVCVCVCACVWEKLRKRRSKSMDIRSISEVPYIHATKDAHNFSEKMGRASFVMRLRMYKPGRGDETRQTHIHTHTHT